MTGYDHRDSSNVQSLHIWILYQRGCPNGQINTFCPPFDGLYDKYVCIGRISHTVHQEYLRQDLLFYLYYTLLALLLIQRTTTMAIIIMFIIINRHHIKTSTGNHRGARTGMTLRITDRTNQLNSTAAATSANHRAAVFVAVSPSNCRLLCSLASRWLGS